MVLLGSWTADFVAAIAVLSAIVYFWLTANFDYWKKKNVPFIKPSFPFGNFGKTFTGKASFNAIFEDFYKDLKDTGYGGIFNMNKPVLVVCKPELIKQVLTKDFSAFHDRGLPYDEENDPFSANLFNLEGQRWKVLRAKLSPTFTSGKIKVMFPLIHDCTNELEDCVLTEIKNNNGKIEMKDLLIRYTTDVIGTCAFGINCNSLKDPNAKFHQMGREIFRSSVSNLLRFVIIQVCPKMASYFTFKRAFSKTTDFFIELMNRTVKFRKENKVERNDFVQMMMRIIDESNGQEFNLDIMTAQAFLFFIAGLDNVANNIGFCLHAIAVDQKLQDRVYREITSVLEEYDGKMSYEALRKMSLVSNVIDEGLRMYTPAGVLMRVQTEEKYSLPGTDFEVEKGVQLMIPIQSIHYDEDFFPNPKKFDPDRFTEEEKSKRHTYAYLPFGEGPRFCIASRFAQLEMRLCFAEMVRHFKFSAPPGTTFELELDNKYFGPTPKNNFSLLVEKRR